jgi:hypothetical protein
MKKFEGYCIDINVTKTDILGKDLAERGVQGAIS